MVSAIAKILGSGNVLEKGLDLIDSMHTSKTEEIAAKTKAKVDLMQAYAPFKIAQRYIALTVTFVYSFSFLLAMALGLWNDPSIATITELVSVFNLQYAFLLILGFYFGGGVFEGGVEAVRKYKDTPRPQTPAPHEPHSRR